MKIPYTIIIAILVLLFYLFKVKKIASILKILTLAFNNTRIDTITNTLHELKKEIEPTKELKNQIVILKNEKKLLSQENKTLSSSDALNWANARYKSRN